MRWRIRTVLVVILVLILILSQFSFFNPVRDRVRQILAVPVRALDATTSRLSTAFRILFTVNDLANENLQLQQEKSQLQAKVASLNAVKAENENLRHDLNFKNAHPELSLTPAQVLSYSPSGLYQAFIINKGSRDGLKTNQAVVSAGYLVGKIHSVSEATAEVWLLTNRNLITPVVMANSQTVGLLKGGIRGLVVENIPLDTKITVGEAAVTSALEGLYPAGIAVGQVAEIISLKEEIFLTLRITSPISIGNLTTVFVVTE